MNVEMQSIEEGVLHVFETMFFREIEASPAAESPEFPAYEVPAYKVEVHFEGDAAGFCELVISAAEATALAADFLADFDQDEPDRVQIEQVLRELGNMVCGHLLSLHAPDSDFRILPPACDRIELQELLPGGRWQRFRLEAGELLARLSISPVDSQPPVRAS